MRTRIARCRPFSVRVYGFIIVVLGFGVYYYYYATSPSYPKPANKLRDDATHPDKLVLATSDRRMQNSTEMQDMCPVLQASTADIDTVAIYPRFEFQPSWLRSKEFWDRSFEDRYEKLRSDKTRPPLKVFVVPHSHNDPGWLRTFEQYFESKTKNIISNIVKKLHQYPNMTFVWTEISFLNAWWERSHPVKQKALKKLIKEGRLEITSGGWVMPDEACTHIYALIDQFLEGHIWVKNNLGIEPKTGWSIDPFGHGPTVPYLLDQSGLDGTIIQRIHYAWKQWLAQHQVEEFYWIPGWSAKKPQLLVHNQPFDIYSIKSSCGPHPSVCLTFDFRRIPGEYNEYTARQEPVTTANLHQRARALMDEYERIGSLTAHNVVLVPLGDDFRYEYASEFDAQYDNYSKMFRYINFNHAAFNSAHVQFGTPRDYFAAVRERTPAFPTLRGDFFVYSDIFSEGKPAYWSGYYTTRPYCKQLARQLEHHLRAAEILFTLVYNHIRQERGARRLAAAEKRLETNYEHLIAARRTLGLFQHHDAITGTSKAAVMNDYGTKMLTSLYHCIRMQEVALTAIMVADETLHTQSVVQSEVEWESYGMPPRKLRVSYADKRKVILFNPLAEQRTEVITLRTNTTELRVRDARTGALPPYQVTPVIEVRAGGRRAVSATSFELQFVATLPALAAVTFLLERHANTSVHCAVFCADCDGLQGAADLFPLRRMMPGDIQLENDALKLLVNRNTGFLRQIYRKDIRMKNVVELQFGAYQSAQRHSGAYLFMPDYDAPEQNVLHQYTASRSDQAVYIVSGPVSTEVTALYLPFLVHTVRIYNVNDPTLARVVVVENVVDFENPPKNRETELFMRIQTDIQNGDSPEFYTDQNGFQYQKRVKVDRLGIEANYYPITTMAWLQDDESRLTLVTEHAQGAAAAEPGRLEVMLDRRTLYDDFRGLGEGVVDNKRIVFRNLLLLERSPSARRAADRASPFGRARRPRGPQGAAYELPSGTADYLSRALNYPVNTYLVDSSDVGEVHVAPHRAFAADFPSGVHLMTLRTITEPGLELFPSAACYMVVQRAGRICAAGDAPRPARFPRTAGFPGVHVRHLAAVSLTGLRTLANLSGLHDIDLQPMDVKTFELRF